jgi:hypothetical protein
MERGQGSSHQKPANVFNAEITSTMGEVGLVRALLLEMVSTGYLLDKNRILRCK